jgi:DUF917 family protein
MAEFASNGKGNLGVTLGAIGTGAAAVEAIVSLINNHSKNTQGGNDCSDNQTVIRYELSLISEIGKLITEVKLRDSSIYTDSKILEEYKYFDGEIKDIRNTLAAQAVHNQKTADAFEMVRNDMICCKNELYTAIARERDDRCCGDNAIINYVNATFYPKMVADVTTGTTTTAQMIYNPLPNCGRCCNG